MKGALPVHLKGGFPTECFLIHGYTGCPGDFNELPEYLHQKCKVDVRVMLLKGHGQEIKALDDVELADILSEVESEFKKASTTHSKIILGGISFGAQLALYLASKYPVDAVFAACMPYRFKFPFNIPGINILGLIKKHWNKQIEKSERELRKDQFFCEMVHVNAFKIIRQANALVNTSLPNIRCPILSVHSKNDPIADYSAIKSLEKIMSHPHPKIVFEDKNHNIFYTPSRNKAYQSIGRFVASKTDTSDFHKITAIVPAFNEEEHIAGVLNVLVQAKILDEIIVVDDASSDSTSQKVLQFPGVKLLRNEVNKGKAYCMEQAVKSTDADILFFCDADLKNFSPDIVERIISPVSEGYYAMHIGMRNNRLQKVVQLFALNSGERALTRELWESIPPYFKRRYRIEAGLNFIAKHHEKSFGWQRFNYYQTVKERKYGFIKGTILRWWMNFDVGCAYFLAFIRSKGQYS